MKRLDHRLYGQLGEDFAGVVFARGIDERYAPVKMPAARRRAKVTEKKLSSARKMGPP